MSHFKVNEKDLFFILKNQLNYGSLCQLDRYRELDEDTLDLLVKEALKFAADGDRSPPGDRRKMGGGS